MTRFRIHYDDPESGKPRSHTCAFEDWTGRAEMNGRPFGEPVTIAAREWAEDLAYSLADKGRYRIEELREP